MTPQKIRGKLVSAGVTNSEIGRRVGEKTGTRPKSISAVTRVIQSKSVSRDIMKEISLATGLPIRVLWPKYWLKAQQKIKGNKS